MTCSHRDTTKWRPWLGAGLWRACFNTRRGTVCILLQILSGSQSHKSCWSLWAPPRGWVLREIAQGSAEGLSGRRTAAPQATSLSGRVSLPWRDCLLRWSTGYSLHPGPPPSPPSSNPCVLMRWVGASMPSSSAVTQQETEASPAWAACQEQQQALQALSISARRTQLHFRPYRFMLPESLWPPKPERIVSPSAFSLAVIPLNGKGKWKGSWTQVG